MSLIEKYKGFSIQVVESMVFDKDKKKEVKVIWWELFYNDKFIIREYKTIDGSLTFSNPNQALNDAKKNIDSLERTKSHECFKLTLIDKLKTFGKSNKDS